ncbi:MAG TPA: hypothetical protein VJN71_08135, partial [Nitrososphaerales archaeon]|nr:hypothetical protein [Nitrososphaerales archaeon]
IVLLDVSRISALPLYDPYHHIVYSARAGDVRDVFVDGRLVVSGGKPTLVDMEKLVLKIGPAVSEIVASSP